MSPEVALPAHAFLEEAYPPEAISIKHDHRPDITELRIEGGVVEVTPLDKLTRSESYFITLGSLGLYDGQIAEHSHYSLANVRKNLAAAYEKLGAANGTHAITQLFQKKMFRVIAPIDLPQLHRGNLLGLLQGVADGNTIEETAQKIGVTHKSAVTYAERIRKQFAVPNLTRAVMLGYLGKLLVPSLDYSSVAGLAGKTHYVITPGHSIRNKDKSVSIDYVEWQGGVFSFSSHSSLTPPEQLSLTLSAIGLSKPEISQASSPYSVNANYHLQQVYGKFRAKNLAHAITLAIATKNIRIHGQIDTPDITPVEHQILVDASMGLKSHEIEARLKMGTGVARGHASSVIKKLGVESLPAAVLMGYLSGSLEPRRLQVLA